MIHGQLDLAIEGSNAPRHPDLRHGRTLGPYVVR
jgi:hypothetical protein